MPIGGDNLQQGLNSISLQAIRENSAWILKEKHGT
jgi:hypothetical protein